MGSRVGRVRQTERERAAAEDEAAREVAHADRRAALRREGRDADPDVLRGARRGKLRELVRV